MSEVALKPLTGPYHGRSLRDQARLAIGLVGTTHPKGVEELREVVAYLKQEIDRTVTALEMFEGAFASDIENDREMDGADTVDAVCSLWHHFIKPALAAARGETRSYPASEEEEG